MGPQGVVARKGLRPAPPGGRSAPPSLSIDPADARQLDLLLRRHRARAKKSFGQNFLIDPAVRDRVLEEAGIATGDDVLEVGAGAGTLTLGLAHRCRRVVAVELDRAMLRVLREVVGALPNVEVVEADILQLDTGALFPEGGEVVVGNIPYYLTGALLPRLLERPRPPRRLSLMVQKEVAERWCAQTGGSLSSVAVQVFARPRYALTIPRSAFQPVPRVDSALVVLDVRERPAVDVPDLNLFFRLVEAAFQQRRKQLGGSFARIAQVGGTVAAERLRAAGVDPTRRPETLTLPEWEAVSRAFPT